MKTELISANNCNNLPAQNIVICQQPESIDLLRKQKFTGEWNSSLFGCCQECSTSCQACFCPGKVQKIVAEQIGREAFNRSRRCLMFPGVCFFNTCNNLCPQFFLENIRTD